jgi:hypothetical protein
MLEAFNYVKYRLNQPFAPLFATIAPMTSFDCLPLQLADLIAFECFRDRGGEERKKDKYRRRKSLELMLATGTGLVLRTIRREWLETLLAENLRVAPNSPYLDDGGNA